MRTSSGKRSYYSSTPPYFSVCQESKKPAAFAKPWVQAWFEIPERVRFDVASPFGDRRSRPAAAPSRLDVSSAAQPRE